MLRIILAAGVVCLAAIYGVLSWRAQDHVTDAGFWFEDLSFDCPPLVSGGYGGPLTASERQRIQDVAWAEVRGAFAGLRLQVAADRDAYYKVRVVQELEPAMKGAAGATYVLPLLGGSSSVNFQTLSIQALWHTPAGSDRATVVDAIGRGIGRSAVHEFLHQLLPRLNIHDSKDDRSYEFMYSSRPAQFYGEMRWDIARPWLLERFGDAPGDRAR